MVKQSKTFEDQTNRMFRNVCVTSQKSSLIYTGRLKARINYCYVSCVCRKTSAEILVFEVCIVLFCTPWTMSI
jgi:hypothetical protein